MLEGFKINCYPLNRTIRVSVHMPSDYNNTNRFYPIIYFLDGQNLYNDEESLSGYSYNLTNIISDLSKNGKDALYIGIASANNEEKRLTEYENTVLADFIINAIHPYLKTRYRVNNFSYAVASAKASLNAIALVANEIFKGLILLSPEIDLKKISDHRFKEDKLYYLYAGNKELDGLCKVNVLKMKTIFPTAITVFDENTIHNESSWKNQLLKALNYLVL